MKVLDPMETIMTLRSHHCLLALLVMTMIVRVLTMIKSNLGNCG